MKMNYKLLEYVLNNSINGVVIVENDFSIKYMNKRAKEILELEDSYENHHLYEFFLLEELDKLERQGIDEFDKLHYKNKTLSVSTLLIDNLMGFSGKAYILQDISKYKNIVDQIDKYKELNKTLECIIHSSYDGIYVTDGQANTLMINSAYERITGIKSEEVLGRNMNDLVKEGLFSQSSSLLAIQERRQVTIRQLIKQSKEVLVTSTPVFYKNTITHVVTNVRDISELVDLKIELMDTKALNERYLTELEYIKSKLIDTPEIVVRDRNMYKVIEMSLRVARVDTTVLLNGETGVGKGELSKFIHKNSPRSKGCFVEVNCGAIPQNLIESELFGYEKGAFTGASSKGKIGLFELANNGTIFLDEISELSLDLQVKLLKIIEDKRVIRLGGNKSIPIDVRIIAATNKNIKEMVEKGKFRDDLYYRLNVVPIYIYALKERKDDIIPLSIKFLNDFNRKYNMDKKLAPSVLNKFLDSTTFHVVIFLITWIFYL